MSTKQFIIWLTLSLTFLNSFPSCARNLVKEDQIIEMLENFYESYLAELNPPRNREKIDSIHYKYLTLDFIDELKNMGLSYDPFINAQDFAPDLAEKLMITKEVKPGIYKISYLDNYSGTMTEIRLLVIQEDNFYKIDSILNLK